MELNSILLIQGESGPTLSMVYPGARKQEPVATIVCLTTWMVLLDFFGAILHLQRTALSVWALQASNPSTQILCRVDNCNIETKAGDSGGPAVTRQGGAVCSFSFILLAAKYFFWAFKGESTIVFNHWHIQQGNPFGLVVMWRHLFRFSAQCLELRMAT